MGSIQLTFEEIKILTIINIVGICSMLGIDIHLASLPHIMAALHTDKPHIQQSVSTFLIGMGIGLLFYGPLSDKYGRKPIIIAGLSFASVSAFASVFSTNIMFFLFTRFLQGLGAGSCVGLARIVAADVIQGEKLATVGSYFATVTSISPLLAPAFGGYIQHWFGWRANFFTLGVIMGLTLLLYSFFCPETNKHLNANAFSIKGLYQNYKSLLKHPLFVGSVLIAGIAMAAIMAYATISPFIFQIQFHVSPITYGWFLAFVGIGGFMGRFVAPFSIRFYGRKSTLYFGILLLLAAGLWLSFFMIIQAINIYLITLAAFFVTLGQVLVNPNTASLALSPFYDKRGAAGALYGSFQILVACLTSAIIGVFTESGVIILAIAYCLLGFFGLIVFYFLVKK